MQHFSYFAKAYAAALYSGLIYLMANIAPEATKLSDISLLVWIGFAAAILGSFGVTAVVTNGPNPADLKKALADALAAKQTALAAKAVDNSDFLKTLQNISVAPSNFPAAAVAAAQAAVESAPIDVHVDLPEAAPVPAAPEVPVPTV